LFFPSLNKKNRRLPEEAGGEVALYLFADRFSTAARTSPSGGKATNCG